ncbi:hypothetical protein WDW86_08105 [Bdellovibrionota bacterium FG-2]
MKTFNTAKRLVVVSLVSLVFGACLLVSDSQAASDDSFWNEIENLTVRCAVVPVVVDEEGNRTYLSATSHCPELAVTDNLAEIKIENRLLVAELLESEYSDGGDLYHLFVKNESGMTIAAKSNIAAFGDIVLGLAGARSRELPEAVVAR